jgi:hypothetical protein
LGTAASRWLGTAASHRRGTSINSMVVTSRDASRTSVPAEVATAGASYPSVHAPGGILLGVWAAQGGTLVGRSRSKRAVLLRTDNR